MGIPSYYRKLKDAVPGFIGNGTFTKRPTTLCFDFNCLIYHVLRRPGISSFEEDSRIKWERALLEEVVKYVEHIVHLVSPTETILLAVDGVVPFAKIRQQRLRRFKRDTAKPTWDTSSITPGTAFMENLGQRLHTLCKSRSHPRWEVEDASVPGEGEQKIMAWLRKQNQTKSVVIYGLDADLIILSLINRSQKGHEINLFREEIELGEVIRNEDGEETYCSLDIQVLEKWLMKEQGIKSINDYALAMCLLGNDFLPHGLSLKMSEEGHKRILELLAKTTSIDNIITYLAETERKDILRSVKKKIMGQNRPPRDSNPDFQPAEAPEKALLSDGKWEMAKNWKQTYRNWLGASTSAAAVEEYRKGLRWIMNYYTGKDISWEWYYPYNLPPLWEDFRETTELLIIFNKGLIPTPQEQLAMVLPIDSFWLVRDKQLRLVPLKHLDYWPKKFEIFCVSKVWMWETIPDIPFVTCRQIRDWTSAASV